MDVSITTVTKDDPAPLRLRIASQGCGVHLDGRLFCLGVDEAVEELVALLGLDTDDVHQRTVDVSSVDRSELVQDVVRDEGRQRAWVHDCSHFRNIARTQVGTSQGWCLAG